MHKFKLDIDNVHKFIVQQSNHYKFMLEENSRHKFTINATDANIIVSLILDKVEYYSTTGIESREVILNEFDVLLKDLPESLRKFIGAYVCVMVRLRGTSSYISSSNTKPKVIARLKSKLEYVSTSMLSMVISLMLRFQDVNTEYKTSMEYYIGVISQCDDSTYSYDASVSCKGYTRIHGNVGFSYLPSLNSVLGVKDSYNGAYDSLMMVDSNKTYQYRVNFLNSFNVNLKDLPEMLIDYCYKTDPDWQDVLDYNSSWNSVSNSYGDFGSLLIYGNKTGSDIR